VAIGAHYDHVGVLPAPLDHDSIRAFNQVVRPRGADDPPRPATAEEAKQVQAILDSLRRVRPARPDSINNGADDDGSGTALMLELAESLAGGAVRPRRSLLFVFHTAEEKGLYGAQYFTDHPPVPLASIVAQINMDQMGRGGPEDAPPGGPNSLVVIGSRRLSTELGDLAERVNAGSARPFHFDYAFDRDGDPTQAYCRSDHYMYARYGIPITFFSAAAWHRDYHMVSDEAQYVAYDRLESITRYVGDFALAVANLDHRPIVDKPKPDPNGTCVQ
jgi:Zn-dependent M28 family amino/carboxypeptidase